MKIFLTLLLALYTHTINAQESFLDKTFGDKGRMNFSFISSVPTQFAKNGLLLSDGRLF